MSIGGGNKAVFDERAQERGFPTTRRPEDGDDERRAPLRAPHVDEAAAIAQRIPDKAPPLLYRPPIA